MGVKGTCLHTKEIDTFMEGLDMDELIEEFVEKLRQCSGKNTVEIRIYVTSEGCDVNVVSSYKIGDWIV